MTQPSRIDGLPDLPKPHAAFEAKMIEDGYTLDFFRNHGSDRYCYMETEWAFRGYEAGSAAAAQAAKQVPAGFVLVPREPTRAMWLAAEKLLKGPNNAYRIWEDMIAAASSATSLAEAAEPVALGKSSLNLAMRGLIGVVGTAQAQAKRILAAEGDADDLRQDRRDLPTTLDVIRHAVESLAATPASPQAPAPQAVVGEASESALGPLDQLP